MAEESNCPNSNPGSNSDDAVPSHASCSADIVPGCPQILSAISSIDHAPGCPQILSANSYADVSLAASSAGTPTNLTSETSSSEEFLTVPSIIKLPSTSRDKNQSEYPFPFEVYDADFRNYQVWRKRSWSKNCLDPHSLPKPESPTSVEISSPQVEVKENNKTLELKLYAAKNRLLKKILQLSDCHLVDLFKINRQLSGRIAWQTQKNIKPSLIRTYFVQQLRGQPWKIRRVARAVQRLRIVRNLRRRLKNLGVESISTDPTSLGEQLKVELASHCPLVVETVSNRGCLYRYRTQRCGKRRIPIFQIDEEEICHQKAVQYLRYKQ